MIASNASLFSLENNQILTFASVFMEETEVGKFFEVL